MQAQDAIVFAFIAFLLLGGGMMARSVQRGRVLCGQLARRFPVEYEALGRPHPGFFASPRRQAYLRFVMQREYAGLADPQLLEQFGALRRSEMRQLVFVLAGFGILGAAALWLEFIHTP